MRTRELFNRIKVAINSNEFIKGILTIFLIGILSFLIMGITFIFSTAYFNATFFESYFASKWLMMMNFIPIFFFFALLFLIFNKLWISFFITSSIFLLMSIVNKYKLIFRDEPFTFIDIKLITESLDMAKKYEIGLTSTMIIMIIGLLIITLLIRRYIKYRINSNRNRLLLIATLLIVGLIVSKGFYFNEDIYKRIGNKDLINIWSESQQFQTKGFVYPFTYSISTSKDRVLEDYDEVRAIELLEEKEYSNIPEDKKINIISIMLESYNDFSKFPGVELNVDIFENFHKIEEDSCSGRLVTNVFGGGTVNTEWSYLTGYNSHPPYIRDRNSFVWYFNEQGYKTEYFHPNFGWFYNRKNINEYLGFQKFDYYENKYEAVQDEMLEDDVFFDYIINGYEESKKEGIPYFNFSLTYQNHGPYSNQRLSDVEYLKYKKEYDEATYNIINNYFEGINKTDKALKKLIEYFKAEDEPVIIVLFGDHNPWLGDEAVGYDLLGIDIDLSTREGFLNYYQTPYLYWANEEAKDILNKDFLGEGETISPNFLMVQLFQYIGYAGDEYMQYIMDVKDVFTVNHDMYFKINEDYTRDLSEDDNKIWREFNWVQYYHGRNFKY